MCRLVRGFDKIHTSLAPFRLLGLAVFFVLRRTDAQKPQPALNGPAETATTAEIAALLQVPEETPVPEIEMTVRISELMPSNKATLADETGAFPDWIELHNYGAETLDISDCRLRCDGENVDLTGISLAPGSYCALFCPKKLSVSGGTAVLLDPKDKELSTVEYEACGRDISVTFDGETVGYTAFPTPGYENSDEGYDAWQSSLSPVGPLVINEVMVYNSSVLRTNNQYYDWVEIRNDSSQAVRLSDYYLSDAGSDRFRYQLPDKNLEPGGIYTIYCTGDPEAVNKDFASFALSA